MKRKLFSLLPRAAGGILVTEWTGKGERTTNKVSFKERTGTFSDRGGSSCCERLPGGAHPAPRRAPVQEGPSRQGNGAAASAHGQAPPLFVLLCDWLLAILFLRLSHSGDRRAPPDWLPVSFGPGSAQVYEYIYLKENTNTYKYLCYLFVDPLPICIYVCAYLVCICYIC